MTLERFEELYDRYSDGSLGPEERREFQAFLSDARFRARFVDLCAFEVSIVEETQLLEEGGKPSVSWEEPAAPLLWKKESPKTSRRLSGVRPRARGAQPWLSAGMAAAGLLVVASGLLFLTTQEGPTRGSHSSASRSRPIPELPMADSPSEPPPKALPPVRPEPPRAAARGTVPVPETPAPEEFAIAAPKAHPGDPLPPAPVPVLPGGETRAAGEAASIPSAASLLPIARVDRSQGEVFLLTEEGPKGGEAGQDLRSGQGLRVGPGSSASLTWSDGTRLDVGADTELARLAEGSGGKVAQLEHGHLQIEAARQAAGRPLVVLTPHAESKVLGTEFSVYATPAYTRLDVREGRVRFTRLPGVSSLVVRAGHYAIAGAGFEFAERMSFSLWKPSMAGLQLWLRADSGVKLAGAGVAAWRDQSSMGNDALQADPSAQPTWVSGVLQGRAALRFNGTDQFLVLPSGFGDFRAGLSAFLVIKVGSSPATMRMLDFGEGPTCDNICLGRKDGADRLSFWIYANCASRGTVTAPGGILLDQFQTLSVVSAPAPGQVTLYRNATPVGSGVTTVPRDVARKPNFIGRSNTSGDALLKGDLCEILLFNRVLKEEDRLSVERYLAGKYFDATAPPALGQPAEK